MYYALIALPIPTLMGIIPAGSSYEIRKLPFRSHLTGRLITEGTWISFRGLPVQLQQHEFMLMAAI
ncbi:hypothetical protein [Sediminibacterium sp.]|uniref:hypothetical protein n=1 Tax=Sediminibacterium sp. TaxID=1917865 RepID=UPI003F6FEEB3